MDRVDYDLRREEERMDALDALHECKMQNVIDCLENRFYDDENECITYLYQVVEEAISAYNDGELHPISGIDFDDVKPILFKILEQKIGEI